MFFLKLILNRMRGPCVCAWQRREGGETVCSYLDIHCSSWINLDMDEVFSIPVVWLMVLFSSTSVYTWLFCIFFFSIEQNRTGPKYVNLKWCVCVCVCVFERFCYCCQFQSSAKNKVLWLKCILSSRLTSLPRKRWTCKKYMQTFQNGCM